MYGVRVFWDKFWGSSARIILVLRGCICNAPAVSLVLPAFDDTTSQSYPPRYVVYHPTVSTLVTASLFLAGNNKDELKPTTFLFS